MGKHNKEKKHKQTYVSGAMYEESVPSWDGDEDGTDLDGDDSDEWQDKETCVVPEDSLEEDMYGMAVCSLVRDVYFVSNKVGTPLSRFSRLATTLFLLLVCNVMQIYLLRQVKKFVSAKAVHDIRDAYDTFEGLMYDEHTLTVNGNKRGVGEMKDPRIFYESEELDDSTRGDICRIPLSEPRFFAAVLLVWTLTCITEFRACKHNFDTLIRTIPTIPSMTKALKLGSDDEPDHIVGLTTGLKASILFLILVPRTGIACYLLWLGCRWLLATNNFGDLILNAVALEFILVMKDLIYASLVPPRNKLDVAKTVLDTRRVAGSDTMIFIGTLAWGVEAVLWVVLYMGIPGVYNGLQQVLPEYLWDVHELCGPWTEWRYCVMPPCPSSALEAFEQQEL